MDKILPELNVKREVRKGRVLYDGYQRGYSLKFSDLSEKIRREPLYIESLDLARGRTIVWEPRLMNIYIILTRFLDKIEFGDIIEFGAYKGGTSIFIANIVRYINPKIRVFALDTFEGMPKSDDSLDLHKEGDFSDVNYSELISFKDSHRLNNLFFIKGRFEETFESVLELTDKFSFVHIDCDIYESVKFSYNAVKKYMVEGGYIVFDDPLEPSCLGAWEVIEEEVIKKDNLNAEQVWPHLVFRFKPINNLYD